MMVLCRARYADCTIRYYRHTVTAIFTQPDYWCRTLILPCYTCTAYGPRYQPYDDYSYGRCLNGAVWNYSGTVPLVMPLCHLPLPVCLRLRVLDWPAPYRAIYRYPVTVELPVCVPPYRLHYEHIHTGDLGHAISVPIYAIVLMHVPFDITIPPFWNWLLIYARSRSGIVLITRSTVLMQYALITVRSVLIFVVVGVLCIFCVPILRYIVFYTWHLPLHAHLPVTMHWLFYIPLGVPLHLFYDCYRFGRYCYTHYLNISDLDFRTLLDTVRYTISSIRTMPFLFFGVNVCIDLPLETGGGVLVGVICSTVYISEFWIPLHSLLHCTDCWNG